MVCFPLHLYAYYVLGVQLEGEDKQHYLVNRVCVGGHDRQSIVTCMNIHAALHNCLFCVERLVTGITLCSRHFNTIPVIFFSRLTSCHSEGICIP